MSLRNSGKPQRTARSSQRGTPTLLNRSANSGRASMWTYISRRPFGPSSSSKRRLTAWTSRRASPSGGNSLCSAGRPASTQVTISSDSPIAP